MENKPITRFRLGSTGEYSVLCFCIGPIFGWANTASLELNALPSHLCDDIYVLTSSYASEASTTTCLVELTLCAHSVWAEIKDAVCM